MLRGITRIAQHPAREAECCLTQPDGLKQDLSTAAMNFLRLSVTNARCQIVYGSLVLLRIGQTAGLQKIGIHTGR